MIRKPRSSDKYGFLDEKQENQMPAFGPDQIISSDLDALVRYLKDDYAKPAANPHAQSSRRADRGHAICVLIATSTAHRFARLAGPRAPCLRRLRAPSFRFRRWIRRSSRAHHASQSGRSEKNHKKFGSLPGFFLKCAKAIVRLP